MSEVNSRIVLDRSEPPRSPAFDAFDDHAAAPNVIHAEESEIEQYFPGMSSSHRGNLESLNDPDASIPQARLQY